MDNLKPFGSTVTCPKCNGTDIERTYSAIEDLITGKRANEYLKVRRLDCGWYERECYADTAALALVAEDDGVTKKELL